ncbi:hypothetical protein DOTSEDRAFT_71686 [Dothistroma septosporum NZE10]|uniref:DUF2406 domain-containing protein n=1 Tax=Dothistroma septosporum (strain NZE10 / CBS 128990) TaxID=675120 RepID=N1PLQ0_DOTSN|nr:hypothetical protein DOTSEDRAFT_71686 [Dothistroma septosporum NZE10]
MASVEQQTRPARPAHGVPPGPQSPSAQSARSRGFSFRSDKSGGSGSKKDKDSVENPADKARRDSFWRGQSKANPNAALKEAEPGVNAIYEESTLLPLRTVQHKDIHGNVIVDPDLSNPTRPRLERPLDTIRSFEKAIDNGYKRRSNYQRSESYEQNNGNSYASRRNSAYGYEGGSNANRPANGGYYGAQRGGHGPPRGMHAQRMASEPMMSNGRPYPPQHGHQYSQDTVATGYTNGSDSTGPWANETNPSSENSSVERGPASQNANNGYGPNGYGPGGFQEGIPEEGGVYPGRAPAVQPPPSARRPIPLGNSGDPITQLPSTKRAEPEKRKSWLGRRFSKKG